MDQNAGIILAASIIVAGASAVLFYEHRRRERRAKRYRSVWTKPWLLRRQEGRSVTDMVHRELREEDSSSFKNYLRMPGEVFDELLDMVTPDIAKSRTHLRDPISARDRLSITLRFLATGESFKSLMYSTRVHHSTISLFVPEVCRSIYLNLKHRGYVKLPQTEDEWRDIGDKFEERWQYPLCLGAIDGKHIAFRPPRSAGSYFFNYKGFNSLVLLGVVDSGYKFIYADAGVNGRISDGGVYKHTSLYSALKAGKLNLPPNGHLPGVDIAIPYHFIGDDAFELTARLMKPYPFRSVTESQKIFNKSLSRARRVVENAFGILANRFRIFLTTINLDAEKVEGIILTCVALHNYLATKNTRQYLDIDDQECPLTSLAPATGRNPKTSAKLIREKLTKYFNERPL